MGGYKFLSLIPRLESQHPPLPDAGNLVQFFGSISFILCGAVDRLRNQLSRAYHASPGMCDTITA